MAALQEFESIRVTVIKLNPPIGADGLKASVTLNLSREQYKKLNMLK